MKPPPPRRYPPYPRRDMAETARNVVAEAIPFTSRVVLDSVDGRPAIIAYTPRPQCGDGWTGLTYRGFDVFRRTERAEQ